MKKFILKSKELFVVFLLLASLGIYSPVKAQFFPGSHVIGKNIYNIGNIYYLRDLNPANPVDNPVIETFNFYDTFGYFRVLQSRSGYNDGMFINFNSYGGQNAHLRFYANGDTFRMVIRADNGYVGIGTFNPLFNLHVAGEGLFDGWVRTSGQRGWFNQTFGGGIYMLDHDWIRTYGNKNFYHNTGIMRTDGVFHVGENGSRFLVNSASNVGIGTTNPVSKLDVYGNYSYMGKSLIYGSKGDVHINARVLTNLSNNEGMNSNAQDGMYLNFKSTGEDNAHLRFYANGDKLRMFIDASNGFVGIGTSHPQSILSVNGTITTKTVITTQTGWSDFVFKKDYLLPAIEDVADFIDQNGHLPGIPTESEIKETGNDLGKTDALLLQKIEELTLYLIDMKKDNLELRKEVEMLKTEKQIR
jgi:hypothetical protein